MPRPNSKERDHMVIGYGIGITLLYNQAKKLSCPRSYLQGVSNGNLEVGKEGGCNN